MSPVIEFEIKELIKRHCHHLARRRCMALAKQYHGEDWEKTYREMLAYFGLSTVLYDGSSNRNSSADISSLSEPL